MPSRYAYFGSEFAWVTQMNLATKIIAALAIGAASISFAHAGWERIDETRSWNTDRVYISGNSRTFFLKRIAPGKSPSGKRYASVIVFETINCESFSVSLRSIAFFDRKGERVDGKEFVIPSEKIIYPDSGAEVVAKTVCAVSDWQRDAGSSTDASAGSGDNSLLGYSDRAQTKQDLPTSIPSLSGYDSETRRTMEYACSSEKLNGPVAYGGCLNRQIASLRGSPGIPSLSGYDSETRRTMEYACSSEKLNGPVAYGGCLRKQVESLSGRS